MAFEGEIAIDDQIRIDHNHPLYLHPSDTPSFIIITHQLIGTENYSVWSRSMRRALLAKNKLGFITGSCAKDKFDDSLHDQWDRCNALVLSWIHNTVSKQLSEELAYSTDSYLVWEDLRERFDKIDGTRIFMLHKELHSHVQGTSSLAAYFSKLRLLWDESACLMPVPSGNSRDYNAYVQQQKLFQFLMGLNETYSNARSQLLLRVPLPSVNDAYAELIQEEKGRSFVGESTGSSPVSETALYSNANASYKKKFTGTCDHCHIKGHKKENCFRLIGFPPDFKSRKKHLGNANSVVQEQSKDDTNGGGLKHSNSNNVFASPSGSST